jgi:hypothetical protein
MLDNGHQLVHALGIALTTGSMAAIVWWALLGFLVGGLAWFLPERFDVKPTPRGECGGRGGWIDPSVTPRRGRRFTAAVLQFPHSEVWRGP